MKLFQALFIVVFLGALYLTWFSFDQLNDQRTCNHTWLVGEARKLNNQLTERLEDWKNELAKKTPSNVGQCLEMKEVAVSKGSPLWPISPFTGLDNIPYWIEDGEFVKEKTEEFESALYHDNYLIIKWLKLKGKVDYNADNIETLLDWAREGESKGKSFIDLSGRVYVHPLLIVLLGGELIKGWRANIIPEDLFRIDNEYIKLSEEEKTTDALLSHQYLGSDFNWILTLEGKAFLDQVRGGRGLILSAVLTIGVFIYAIFFFYRNQTVLARQSALRERMVSDISHELRTPVTTIRLYAEMLRDGRVKEKVKQQLYYNRVVNESLRLERLIENVLDFSRISQHRLNIKLESIKLGKLQNKLEEVIDFLDENNRVVFNWNKNEIISADLESAIQVFYNLISNALKYSESGPIELASTCAENKILITIKDQGEGIPSDETKNLFESFFRGKKSHRQQIQGSGLGLGIARGLMEAMKGSLDFVGNHSGACFEATFISGSEEIED